MADQTFEELAKEILRQKGDHIYDARAEGFRPRLDKIMRDAGIENPTAYMREHPEVADFMSGNEYTPANRRTALEKYLAEQGFIVQKSKPAYDQAAQRDRESYDIKRYAGEPDCKIFTGVLADENGQVSSGIGPASSQSWYSHIRQLGWTTPTKFILHPANNDLYQMLRQGVETHHAQDIHQAINNADKALRSSGTTPETLEDMSIEFPQGYNPDAVVTSRTRSFVIGGRAEKEKGKNTVPANVPTREL